MSFLLHILISIAHWLPTVLGYNLVFGKGKIFHFGPLGVSLATSYAMFIALGHWDSYPIAILCGTLMAIAVSLFFTWLSLRLEPDALGVMTIAVYLMIIAVVLNWTDMTRGALGIPGIQRVAFMNDIGVYAAITCGLSALIFCFYVWLDRTAFGRQISALAEHEWHAKSLGVNRAKVHAMAFTLLGLSHVFGGLFAIPYLHLLHPNDFLFPVFIFLVMIVVAGKPGSVWGVTIATIALTILREALRFVPLPAGVLGPVRLILFGLILFIAVWWRRDTLFPQRRSI